MNYPKVPPRYENVKWEDIPEDLQKKFEEVPKTLKGLYLFGGVGTGKTHIAYTMFKCSVVKARMISSTKNPNTYEKEELIYKEERPIFWNTTELFREIRMDFDRSYEMKKRVEEEIMKSRGLLFIDDIGSEKTSDWVMETFYLIINHRYNHRLPIIFTSNLSISQLANTIGERIASRIVEMCDIIPIKGVDRRLN
jgi:DNA replication protein DnaC